MVHIPCNKNNNKSNVRVVFQIFTYMYAQDRWLNTKDPCRMTADQHICFVFIISVHLFQIKSQKHKTLCLWLRIPVLNERIGLINCWCHTIYTLFWEGLILYFNLLHLVVYHNNMIDEVNLRDYHWASSELIMFFFILKIKVVAMLVSLILRQISIFADSLI